MIIDCYVAAVSAAVAAASSSMIRSAGSESVGDNGGDFRLSTLVHRTTLSAGT